MFELARHWARRFGVSERKEDLESVSAKKILAVTIEVVDVLVGVGVSVVRVEAIVVTTEDGVGGIIKVAVDVATAVTVVTSTETTTTTVLSAPNGHAVPAREAGGGVGDVEASLGMDIAEVAADNLWPSRPPPSYAAFRAPGSRVYLEATHHFGRCATPTGHRRSART